MTEPTFISLVLIKLNHDKINERCNYSLEGLVNMTIQTIIFSKTVTKQILKLN